MVYLGLAGFWLIVGCGLIVWQWLHPEAAHLTIRGTGISYGWLVLALGLYNCVRCWSRWSLARGREALANRQRHREPTAHSPAVGADPQFNFTDEPPAGP